MSRISERSQETSASEARHFVCRTELTIVCLCFFRKFEAIAGNAKAVGQYKEGNTKALNALKGPVMKATKGKANPAMLDDLLKKLIDEG